MALLPFLLRMLVRLVAAAKILAAKAGTSIHLARLLCWPTF